jgi:phenylacetate-coenzyme A ligase PaaK-like adenylate-forming protein
VYGWRDWVEFMLLQTRWSARRPAPVGVIGSTFANKGQHVSGALHAFFADDKVSVCHVPATMPLAEIVAAMNSAQPVTLQGYPTSIRLLANEAKVGRLRIRPAAIGTCGEQLTDDVREAAFDAWGLQVDDVWGCTEGVYGYSCDAQTGMHIPDDLVIVEPVDDKGEPVPAGQPAAKIYLTNLYNHTQPLIRYEITDAMTLLDNPCPCGCAHRRIADIRGHSDDVFVYGNGIVVQPIGLYTALEIAPEVIEFQVVQTPGGVDVKVRAHALFDTEPLRAELAATMAESGLTDPQVTVQPIDELDRLWSGKLRRFVPIVTPVTLAC